MKKIYNTPFAEMTEIFTKDMITASFTEMDPTSEEDLNANHDNKNLSGMSWN